MEKFLPVGTICTLQGDNRKYFIMGYFSLEYNKTIKMYDYMGLPYPEGFLKNNKQISFNHSDISKVDYMGYVNDDFRNFNNSISGIVNEVEEIKDDGDLFNNFSFDENGVVTYESVEPEPEISNEVYFGTETQEVEEFGIRENPFNTKITSVNIQTETEESPEEWNIFKKIEFDENGVVIETQE